MDVQRVGLTAGTSTLESTVDEVEEVLRRIPTSEDVAVVPPGTRADPGNRPRPVGKAFVRCTLERRLTRTEARRPCVRYRSSPSSRSSHASSTGPGKHPARPTAGGCWGRRGRGRSTVGWGPVRLPWHYYPGLTVRRGRTASASTVRPSRPMGPCPGAFGGADQRMNNFGYSNFGNIYIYKRRQHRTRGLGCSGGGPAPEALHRWRRDWHATPGTAATSTGQATVQVAVPVASARSISRASTRVSRASREHSSRPTSRSE